MLKLIAVMQKRGEWVVYIPGKERRYLGEVDRGVRQGVANIKYASRFSERGAFRVAKDYPHALVLYVGPA